MQKSTTILEVKVLDLLCKVKMKGDDYTFDTKYEVAVGHDFKDYGCYFIQAEYMEACEERHKVVWIRKLMTIGLNLTCR
jgi:hypothetical protein